MGEVMTEEFSSLHLPDNVPNLDIFLRLARGLELVIYTGIHYRSSTSKRTMNVEVLIQVKYRKVPRVTNPF